MFMCVLLVIGILGNFFVCYVYFCWKEKGLLKVFILFLVIVDFFNCFIIMLIEFVMMINFMNFDFNIICKLFWFFIYLCNIFVVFIMVVIVIDRY